MADTKFSALTAASAAVAANELAINEAGTSKKLTVGQVNTFLNPIKFVTSEVANSTTTLEDVTDLTFSLNAGSTYVFRGVIFWTTTAATVGVGIAVNGPASPTRVQLHTHYQIAFTGNATDVYSPISTYSSSVPCLSGIAVSTMVAYLDCVVINGVNAGDFNVQFRSEINTSSVSIIPPSYLCMTRI